MTPEQLKKRTFLFGQQIIAVCRSLVGPLESREIAMQLLDCGTSVGANYRAVCRARSKKEFIAKMGVAVEQADKSEYWLAQLLAAGFVKTSTGEPLRVEAEE